MALALTLCASACKPQEEPEEEPAPDIAVAANDAAAVSPLDATPSPSGDMIHFIAFSTDEDGDKIPAIYEVSVTEPDAPTEMLASGDPFVIPIGISVSLDGSTLYIADIGSGDESSDLVGVVYSMSSDGSAPSELSGTVGYRPQGVAIAKVDDEEYLYFTGREPGSDTPGVFRVSAAGGNLEDVASGPPFFDPSGLVVVPDGTVYVTDAESSGDLGGLIRVANGEASVFVENLALGTPAGVSSTMDGSTIVVSGLDPGNRSDRVFFIDAASAEIVTLDDPFSQFYESAGLHRAHEANFFAWADSEANDHGTVYSVSL